MINVLIVYYSRHGATRELAKYIAQGVEQAGAEAVLRTVPTVSSETEQIKEEVPASGDPYVTQADIKVCGGLALGSPTRFGNMAASMKYFIDSTTEAWVKGSLIDKPACVFTSSTSMHGGQESTLLSMMLPLIHHGMMVVGLPYSESDLHHTTSGGTPYGVTHVAGVNNSAQLTDEEKRLAIAQGKRIAILAKQLKRN